MKVTDQHPDFWDTQDESWPKAIATTAVFVLICIVLYLAVITAGAAK